MAAELLVKAHGIECGSNRAIWLEMAFRQTRRVEMVAEEIEPSFETPDEGLAWVRMTAYGCVSRVSPVQTALRNCTRDEGGPFGFGDQELIPSYRRLLWSKAMVVSVAEKSGR